jgi:hypothetical protein
VYTNTNGQGYTIQLVSAVGGPVWAFLQFGSPYGISSTQPAPAYPWLATGYGFDLRSFTAGPC